MRDEFVITRQGKQYVLFAGLLDEAHERFTSGFDMDTELLHLEPVPIVRAHFEGVMTWEPTGEKKVIRTTGIGTGARDSDTKGPGKDAPVEMAETRAKARALRDAINVGATAFEEMGDDGGNPTPQSTPNRPSKPSQGPAKTRQGSTPTPSTQKPQAGSQASPVPGVPPEATNKKEAALQATRQQIAKLNKLMEFRAVQTDQGVEDIREGFVDFIGFDIKDLSRGEAHKYIRSFERKIEAHEESEAS